MTAPWHELHPDLVKQIQGDLAQKYPTLHFLIEQGKAIVFGAFPVLGEHGKALDHFQVAIRLPSRYPRDLPITRETGGRIPPTLERHISWDGTACVLLPDARWNSFPVGAPFIKYLDGPLRNYFLGQLVVEGGGNWPFGEWGHGPQGILEYYLEALGTQDPEVALRFLSVLRRSAVRLNRLCPCGSGSILRDCCLQRIVDLRGKIDRTIAAKSHQQVSGLLRTAPSALRQG